MKVQKSPFGLFRKGLVFGVFERKKREEEVGLRKEDELVKKLWVDFIGESLVLCREKKNYKQRQVSRIRPSESSIGSKYLNNLQVRNYFRLVVVFH